MLIDIIHFFIGYIKIELRGVFIERFLNMCAKLNVSVWNLKRFSDGAVCSLSIKDFYKLRDNIKKTGVSLVKAEKCGLPYIIYKYRKRYGIAVGAILFTIILYSLSMFVWSIEVVGNKNITREEIINVLQENGFEAGIYKKNVDLYNIKRGVMLSDKRISLININICGSVAEVEIKESRMKPEIIDKNEICDIVALRDGYILNVLALNGTPAVKKGDSVIAGQKLISGVIRGKDSLRFVHSNGKVIAETFREHTVKIPKIYEYKHRTGKSKKRYALKVFDKKVNLFLDRFNPYEKYELKTDKKNLVIGGKLELPFAFVKNTYYEINTINKKNSRKAADKKAEISKKNYENKYLLDTKIINCDIIKKEDDNNYIYIYQYVLNEQIGIKKLMSKQDVEEEKAKPTSEFQEVY